MPNWVTNRVNAPQHVLEAMLSDDRQSIDFNKIATCDFPYDWDGYFIGAQYLASEAVGETLCVEQQSLEDRVAKLQDDELEQYHGMVENFKATGYLNFMKFARAVWGTKWNACRSDIDFIEQGQVMFETAWSCPIGVFQHLSTKFPNDKITVEFADENIGYNCGTIKFLGGQIVFQNKAPSYVEWEEKEQRAQWIAFACDVQGYDYANYMKELEEDEQMMYNMTFNLTKADLEKIIKDAILKQNPNLDITSVSFNIGTSGDYRDSYSVVTGANVVAVPKKV